jgi:hypothetical protein
LRVRRDQDGHEPPLGKLAGALLGQLGATYLVLFVAMLGTGILQNPMFGSGTPSAFAAVLPDYGAARVVVDGAFGAGFAAQGPLVLALSWTVVAGRSLAGSRVTRSASSVPTNSIPHPLQLVLTIASVGVVRMDHGVPAPARDQPAVQRVRNRARNKQ